MPMQWSRHIKSFKRANCSEEAPEWLDNILQHAQSVDAQVIFPMQEESSLFCIRNHAALEQQARLTPLPSEEHFALATDKGRLAEFMHQHGIAHPRSILHRVGESDPEELLKLLFPIILKPRKGEFGEGIRKVDTEEELLPALARYEPGNRLIVQEFIEGEDIDCSFLAQNGEVQAWTIQRPIESAHEDFSAANDIEFVNDEQTRDIAHHLASSLQWTGVAHVDMRRSRVDGKVRVLEINARIWGSLMGSIAAGVNVPEYACRSALGMETPPVHQRTVRFTNRGCGIGHALRACLPGRSNRFRISETHFPFFIRDPMPDLIKRFARSHEH